MEYKPNRTWAEVSLDNLVHNYTEFRRIVSLSQPGKKVKIMGVVKANAYGHGAVTAAQTLVREGADYLAVASLDEAIELRRAGISAPLLILNSVARQRSEEVILHNLTLTVYQQDCVEALSAAAACEKKRAKVHIKLDTGMTRIGLPWDNAKDQVLRIARLPGIEIEGIFTHLAAADEKDKTFTVLQFERFMRAVKELEKSGLDIPIRHVCNSAGAIMYPDMHLDMIRPGISLYGCYPSEEVDKSAIHLKPVMSLKTEIIRVSEVEADTGISYGRIFKTAAKSKIATLPVGYADGLARTLTGKAQVLINGQFAPVVGRICMDQCMADISGISGDVKTGDEAVIFGTQKDNTILASDVAKLIGTIDYEVLCSVSRRVPRFYIENSILTGVENYLAL